MGSSFLWFFLSPVLIMMTKNYRVQVETYDGCITVWYEQSKAKKASSIICDRVYKQLCGLNIREIDVTVSV